MDLVLFMRRPGCPSVDVMARYSAMSPAGVLVACALT